MLLHIPVYTPLNHLYISDNNQATLITTIAPPIRNNASIDDLHRNSMQDGRLSFVAYGVDSFNPIDFFDYQDNNLRLIYNQRLYDPSTGQFLFTQSDAQPYSDGVVFHSEYYDATTGQEQNAVCSIQRDQLHRLFGINDLFGDTSDWLIDNDNGLQYSRVNFLISTGTNINSTKGNILYWRRSTACAYICSV